MFNLKVTTKEATEFTLVFPDMQACVDYVEQKLNTGVFGLPERWSGILVGEALDTRENEEGVIEYLLPSEFSYVIEEDVSYEAIQESNEARQYLRDTDWYIIREMDSGATCPQEIKDARALARTKVID